MQIKSDHKYVSLCSVGLVSSSSSSSSTTSWSSSSSIYCAMQQRQMMSLSKISLTVHLWTYVFIYLFTVTPQGFLKLKTEHDTEKSSRTSMVPEGLELQPFLINNTRQVPISFWFFCTYRIFVQRRFWQPCSGPSPPPPLDSCICMFKRINKRLIGPRHKKTCLRGVANNKGADQPAHPRSLISACVIRLLESILYKLATDEISIF